MQHMTDEYITKIELPMTNEYVVNQYKKGLSINSIIEEYLDADKVKSKQNGYKPITKKETTEIVYRILVKHWNEVYENDAIVRITFITEHVMLFGDSYKTWDDQLKEYWRIFGHKLLIPKKVEISKTKWKGFGGLKWCNANDFQVELNREGCQTENEPDNPNPRQYKDMVFEENKRVTKKVMDICK